MVNDIIVVVVVVVVVIVVVVFVISVSSGTIIPALFRLAFSVQRSQLPPIRVPELLNTSCLVLAQIEEVHRLGDVQQTVGIVLETPLLAGVIEIRLDEEVRAQSWWETGLGTAPSKALLPFGPASVGDCC